MGSCNLPKEQRSFRHFRNDTMDCLEEVVNPPRRHQIVAMSKGIYALVPPHASNHLSSCSLTTLNLLHRNAEIVSIAIPRYSSTINPQGWATLPYIISSSQHLNVAAYFPLPVSPVGMSMSTPRKWMWETEVTKYCENDQPKLSTLKRTHILPFQLQMPPITCPQPPPTPVPPSQTSFPPPRALQRAVRAPIRAHSVS